MKRIDTSFASSTSGQPLTAAPTGTPSGLGHLQQSYGEGFANTMRQIIGDNYSAITLYRLWGCEYTGLHQGDSSGVFSITTGALLYNGEIFMVDATSFNYGGSATGLDTAIGISFADVTGTQFTDGSVHEILQIRKIVFSAQINPTPPPLGLLSYSEFEDTSVYLVPMEIRPKWFNNVPNVYGANSNTPLLNTGWTNVAAGGGFGYKLEYNEVKLCGLVQSSLTLVANEDYLVATLPFVSTYQLHLHTFLDNAAALSPVEIIIEPVGSTTTVTIIPSVNSTGALISFESLSFRLL